MSLRVRAVEIKDYQTVSDFLMEAAYTHKHLDWRIPQDWVGRQPFFILEEDEDHSVQAILACPTDPQDVAWVRVFAVSKTCMPSIAWELLFPPARAHLAGQFPLPTIVSLAFQPWYEHLLQNHGLCHHHDIIVLSWQLEMPPPRPLPAGMRIREMEAADLPRVHQIDTDAFELIWRHSLESLTQAYLQAGYATVLEAGDGQLIGYQISTDNPDYLSAHLARLAVSPQLQHHGLGYALVRDMLAYFNGERYTVTVNTQSTNHISQALYRRLGFEPIDEYFPVYAWPWAKTP